MTDLASKAMLARLSISNWTGKKNDSMLAERFAKSQHANRKTVTLIKNLVPMGHPEFARIGRICRFAREEHMSMTLPGFLDGERLLSSKMFFRYTNIMRGLQAEFRKAVDEFIEVFPEITRKAPERLGDMFKAEDFPTAAAIRSQFAFNLNLGPVPTTRDWRLDGIDQELIEDLKKDAEEEAHEVMRRANMEVYSRLRAVLERLADQSEKYEQGVFPTHPGLREALFRDLTEMAEILPILNIGEDPVLDDIAQKLTDNICIHKAEEVRSNEKLRKEIAEMTRELIKRVD